MYPAIPKGTVEIDLLDSRNCPTEDHVEAAVYGMPAFDFIFKLHNELKPLALTLLLTRPQLCPLYEPQFLTSPMAISLMTGPGTRYNGLIGVYRVSPSYWNFQFKRFNVLQFKMHA